MSSRDLKFIHRGSVMSTIHDACYENTSLDLHELDLDRLYGGRYSSLAHFRIYGAASRLRFSAPRLARLRLYVARTDGAATAVLVFRQHRRWLEVLNEGIRLETADLTRFARHMFATQPKANAIAFRYIQTGAGSARLAPAWQEVACGDDTVLTLAATARQYLDSLGSSTRSTLKYRLNRLRREFPTFTLTVHEKQQVDPAQLRAIIGLNRLRMRDRDKTCAIDAEEEERIVHYVRERGFVTVATIDGQICAGAICYRFGDHFAARCLAHDPQYDAYRLGFLCAYLSIVECTKAAPGGQFNFGWGRYDYKSRLGGLPRTLSKLVLYRSSRHMLHHPGLASATAMSGAFYRLKQAARQFAARNQTLPGWLANLARRGARWLKSASRVA